MIPLASVWGKRRVNQTVLPIRTTASLVRLRYNESMSVSDDGYALFLQPLGMAHYFAQQTDPALTMEGAGEYFWSLFVDRLR